MVIEKKFLLRTAASFVFLNDPFINNKKLTNADKSFNSIRISFRLFMQTQLQYGVESD